MTLLESLAQAAALLAREERAFATVGGVAVSARTEPRFTRDIDLAVAVSTDKEAETLVSAFVDEGYQTLALIEQEATQRLATVRLQQPGAPVVDLLFSSSGIEAEIVEGAEALELVPGLVLPVARIGHLLAIKVLARDDQRRPQDLADINVLLRHASDEEIERARAGLRLIAERGYHRNRDLSSAFDALLETR